MMTAQSLADSLAESSPRYFGWRVVAACFLMALGSATVATLNIATMNFGDDVFMNTNSAGGSAGRWRQSRARAPSFIS